MPLPTRFLTLTVLLTLACTSVLFAHGHITLYQSGGKLIITAGPGDFQIIGNQIYDAGDPLNVVPLDVPLTVPVAGTPLTGWTNDETLNPTVTLVSDAFAANLGAGSYYFEMAIQAADGSPTAALAAHGLTGNMALSNGATRLDRSLAVPVVNDIATGLPLGSHEHGQLTYVDTPGHYRIQLTAWTPDAGYLDSNPVYFLVTVPEPASATLLGAAGLGLLFHRRRNGVRIDGSPHPRFS